MVGERYYFKFFKEGARLGHIRALSKQIIKRIYILTLVQIIDIYISLVFFTPDKNACRSANVLQFL